MIKRALFFIFILISIVRAGVKPDKIITYKRIGDIDLTLHIFNPPRHGVSDKTPVIVFFSGGGWRKGAPSVFYKQSHYLASRGMIAICADYRVESRHGTTPQECVKDGKSAIRWVRAHALELGMDPERIAAGGGSAGGQIAAAAALLDGFNEEGETTTVSCIPDALVLFHPVIDNGPDGYGYGRVQAYWQDFSPIRHIDKDAPPTLIMVGTADGLVPVETVEKYKALMNAAGVRCDLQFYEGLPHSGFVENMYYETMLETDLFLISLGYLQGEPTL